MVSEKRDISEPGTEIIAGVQPVIAASDQQVESDEALIRLRSAGWAPDDASCVVETLVAGEHWGALANERLGLGLSPEEAAAIAVCLATRTSTEN